MHCRFIEPFCEEVYGVAFFKVVQQQTTCKVGNSIICLLANNFLSATVKELLKSDSICESYAQMKKGPVFYDSQTDRQTDGRTDRIAMYRKCRASVY